MRTLVGVLVVSSLLLAIGCGRPSPRRVVQGDVTLGGVPLGDGTITFYPSTGTAGAAGAARIERGKYYVSAEKGLEPGKYRVQLSSPQRVENGVQDRVPPDYNGHSQQVIEVTGSGENRFDFAIPR